MRHLFLLFLCFPIIAQADSSLCKLADSAIEQASTIRGLKIKAEVPCLVQDKEEVKQYLLTTIDKKIPPDKLRYEEIVYKALGIIPEDFEYKQGLIDLYVSQIGGYYEPEEDHFVMAAWLPMMLQATVAVHELTHALQDQYFDLAPFMDMFRWEGDQILARAGLVEGDASAVMFDYTRQLAGQKPLAEEKDISGLIMQSVLGAAMVADLQKMPQSIVKMMLFPYTSGLRFAHYLLQQGGYQEIDRAFSTPPRSTEEILHPEKYYKGEGEFVALTKEEVAKPFLSEGDEIVYTDIIGEFGISILLEALVEDGAAAARGAAGWGGDRVVVLENKPAKSRKVIWWSNWDSGPDLAEFLELFRRGYKKKYPNRSVEYLEGGGSLDFPLTKEQIVVKLQFAS